MPFSRKKEKKMREIREYFNKKFPKNPEKTILFLRGFCSDRTNPKPQTLIALGLARKHHHGMYRENGEPYIVHPFQMACNAISMGITDDIIIAIILVHDVYEDTDAKLEESGLSDEVKQAVKLITFEPEIGETKKHYYESLKKNPYALLVKAFDRYHNLSTMSGVLSRERIVHNLRETLRYLLPILKEARDMYPHFSNVFYRLRDDIKTKVIDHSTDLEIEPEELEEEE